MTIFSLNDKVNLVGDNHRPPVIWTVVRIGNVSGAYTISNGRRTLVVLDDEIEAERDVTRYYINQMGRWTAEANKHSPSFHTGGRD